MFSSRHLIYSNWRCFMGTIKYVLNLKEVDILCLDKTVDEDMDVNINGKNIALGESIKSDDKISVRILDFKSK